MKTVIITSGGTEERIDNVRKITNFSSGTIGKCICDTIVDNDEIDKIYYICTKNTKKPDLNHKVTVLEIIDVKSLRLTIEKLLKNEKIDYFIHAMAVSDYTTKGIVPLDSVINNTDLKEFFKDENNFLNNKEKLSSSNGDLLLVLTKTPKIISLIKEYQPLVKLIGFKLLSNVTKEELYNVAYKLLKDNKCDYVIANDLKDIREGSRNALIIDNKGKVDVVYGKNLISQYINDIIKK